MTLPRALLTLPALALLLSACGGGIQDLKTYKYAGGQHQEGRIQYAENPPVGGTHNPIWQNCGVYTAPIYDEYGVHSMEHGAVWITYRPSLASAEVDKLKALVDGHSYTLLSPRDNLPAPIVISAWNAQVQVQTADDRRLGAFLKKYEQGSTAPERGAACSGGYGGTQ
ncbi:DUF3105 domain-containing protein [Deinococcus sonorensis]|uniref:DUF3105 domain-containing protein n=2 Tax=Deinococcus sonorensis TaxID=309891 RepID=A0AAU7UEU4_9DEIO